MTQERKTIYLLTEGEWYPFDLNGDDIQREFEKRNISIGNGASIGNRASIGYHARIENDASIGDDASIGSGASIGSHASIGDDASIGSGARIGNRASIGNDASIGGHASIGYGASIGNDASIGGYASIGDDARIVQSIFIKGSLHTVNWWGSDQILIGCHQKTIKQWKRNYKKVGEQEECSEEQIKEYKQYIDMIEQLYNQ